VLIDESHNLRNKEGKRWKVIRAYIERNDSHCILLSATPYNKTYLDLSAQLSLFLREDSRHRHSPRKAVGRTWVASMSSSAATSALCVRWPRSRRAKTPMTGAI
jgi:hypothetical protein